MKPQYYLFSNNVGVSNVVMLLADCLAIIESDTAELMKNTSGEVDIIEYNIQASMITEEEYQKLHEAEF